jgi:hypothetical protein
VINVIEAGTIGLLNPFTRTSTTCQTNTKIVGHSVHWFVWREQTNSLADHDVRMSIKQVLVILPATTILFWDHNASQRPTSAIDLRERVPHLDLRLRDWHRC